MSPFISKPDNFGGGLATEKVMTFVILKEVAAGNFDGHVSFPFDGEISEITAVCSINGNQDANIIIEKSNDMVNWVDIFDTPIVIKQGEYYDDGKYTLQDSTVQKGETFRLVIKQSGNIRNLTVNIKVKIKL